MIAKLAQAFTFVMVTATGAIAAPMITQSLTVDFPVSGRVTIQSREEIGKFPQMVFVSQTTNKPLLISSVEDHDKWLIPVAGDTPESRPALRFRVIRSRGFTGPMIMSVGLYTGGSDNAYFLTLFAEVAGHIIRLNAKPLFANVQGGYYLGHLNQHLGYGLAVWNFVWATGPHYSKHEYALEIYRIRGTRMQRILRTTSRKMYDSDKGAASLLELGIKASDQRDGIPRIKDTLN
jgi:hypothetical protein